MLNADQDGLLTSLLPVDGALVSRIGPGLVALIGIAVGASRFACLDHEAAPYRIPVN